MKLLSELMKFDLIILSEVKLQSHHPISLYKIPGFTSYASLRAESAGGGILTFISNSLIVQDFKSESSSFEKLTINFSTGQHFFRLVAYYPPPNPNNFYNFTDDLENVLTSSSRYTFIVGDVNISPDSNDTHSNLYNQLLASYGFIVFNNKPTRSASGRVIDHFANNFSNKHPIYNYTFVVDESLTDHNAVLTVIGTIPREPRKLTTIINTNVDYSKLVGNFPDISSAVVSSNDPEVIVGLISSAITLASNQSTKTKEFIIKHNERICEWSSDKSLKFLKEKDKWLKKRRKNPRSDYYKHMVSKTGRELELVNRSDFATFVRKKVSTNDPKKMWRNLNDVLGRKKPSNAIPEKMLGPDGSAESPRSVVNTLNSHFISCANTLLKTSVSVPQQVEHQPSSSLKLVPPDEDEVKLIINRMKKSSAAGHDGISPGVVKKLAPKLVPLIVHLISVIFSTGIYPLSLKLAIVQPLFKSGDKKCVDNYRPISMLPVLSRIVERVIHRRLFDYFDNHLKLIYKNQFGFRPNSGTENAAVELTDLLLRAIDGKKIASAVFMDLQKAFDVVDHKILLEVLHKYGVRGRANDLLHSFLSNRTQRVISDGVYSDAAPIVSGVIQGSCLGPLLFTIFFNAIGSLKIAGKLFLFADDAVLINIHDKADSIAAAVNNDMSLILSFLTQRKMFLNGSKTKFMLFSMLGKKINFLDSLRLNGGLIIERVKTYKYLGLILDENLTFTDHVHSLEKKLAPANGVLWKLNNVLPFHHKKVVYNTLFQSHLSYMSSIWALIPFQSLEKLQILQNRALRNVYNVHRRESRTKCTHI